MDKINTDIQHEKETNTIVLVFSVVIPIDKNSMLNQHTDIQLTSGMAVTAGPWESGICIEYLTESVDYYTQSAVIPPLVRETGRVTSSAPERFTGKRSEQQWTCGVEKERVSEKS